MSEMISPKEYQRLLELAPTNMLEQEAEVLFTVLEHQPEGTPDFEMANSMIVMLMMERSLREVEPLWRKAKRFAIRNSSTIKEVGKIAACIGAGVLLGVSLDD